MSVLTVEWHASEWHARMTPEEAIRRLSLTPPSGYSNSQFPPLIEHAAELLINGILNALRESDVHDGVMSGLCKGRVRRHILTNRLIKAQLAIVGKWERAFPYDRFRMCYDQPQDRLRCGLSFTF